MIEDDVELRKKEGKRKEWSNPGSQVDEVKLHAAPMLLAKHMNERMRQ